MRPYPAILLFLMIVLVSGCASAGAGKRVTSRDLIQREEITSHWAANAFDLIQSLRPQWLWIRDEIGIGRANDIVVYLDGARLGGRESLRGVSIMNLQALRFFNATAANLRFGAGHSYGVIQLSTNAEIR
jgi:hypothetical protein